MALPNATAVEPSLVGAVAQAAPQAAAMAPSAPSEASAAVPRTATCSASLLCSHSISTRLSRKLALFTIAVLGILSFTSWWSVGMLIKERNAEDLALRCQVIDDILTLEAVRGGEAAVLSRLAADAGMRGDTRLEVRRADGSLLYADKPSEVLEHSQHVRSQAFDIEASSLSGGALRLVYTADFSRDAAMGRRWAYLLASVTLLAGTVVALGSFWHVRRSLKPLKSLAAQTQAISAQSLDRRLHLDDPAEELRPWIDQFNGLMVRLERAYAQLEGFNADVAHELRTPLANLIGETEVALSRPRSAAELQDTLASNLEEMQRLSAMINDMLFLASADRGAQARRGEPISLARLAHQVSEFHEGPLEEAGLRLQVDGDAQVPVDEALVKRALSNLLSNAARFADHGSTVVVRIHAGDAPQQVSVVVENRGQAIEPQHLPRLFDRFFRGDSSRCCPNEQHHGLCLAIVAAIARMHAGHPMAESEAGRTRVGFTLAAP
jgi:two-component system, OmpR family, heavy metal sensor histidine kinase CusS